MRRRKRDGNHSPLKNNLLQNWEAKEENRYLVPNSNKTKINDPKKPNDVHQNTLKKDILQVITENFMEMILQKVNQNVEALKKFQETKN
jgi:hypothetical protein